MTPPRIAMLQRWRSGEFDPEKVEVLEFLMAPAYTYHSDEYHQDVTETPQGKAIVINSVGVYEMVDVNSLRVPRENEL